MQVCKFWPYENDIYISQQLIIKKIFIMQKGALSTPLKGKTINYFKYEMKDTNQLLKDLISCNMSDTVSRSGENKQQNHIHDVFKQTICMRKIENSASLDHRRQFLQKRLNENQQKAREMAKDSLKCYDQYQNDQSQIFKQFINDSHLNAKRKKQQNSMEDLILQKFFVDVSENEDNQESQKPSIQKYKNRDLEYNGNDKSQENRQSKKQKKGLANISLRVKNIVSEHRKLTYKQVSDLVLDYSKDEIDQLDESQKIRQIKNIKRRVYDALNVLVAVGILGKHQRCVCMTEWTNIPGKKHSSHWQKINSKIQHINKLKKSCSDKSQALKLLVDKYNAITSLRNKHKLQEEQTEVDKEGVNWESIKTQEKQEQKDKKLEFPVIVFCPAFDQDQSDKLTVQLQDDEEQNQENDQEQKKQKVKISGKNITILGDFDCALQLNLEKYRDSQKQKQLLCQIQQYANECLRKRVPAFKVQTDDYGQANIEDYFNQQMFESN